ncbi:hypothetical protein CEY09_31750 [Achromobacter marplatensis]|uniref:Phage protein n=3 Tax=Achromobacter marplatensis TaxID=470868 RepID=A0ABX9FRT6_9BURK|nr:hypothetical protein CEY09_31750 [Achromobacter marplatensis]RBP08719.1 hypothetical protein DFP87_1431 [Achromobacter marplatensis]CAB3717725.1 hypothetical protein LMG26219_06337 [Achromobacter marplatensis]
MSEIEQIVRTAYRAPTRGRTYLNPRSAAKAEAAAMLQDRYPTENAEYEDGHCYYPGFHWSSDERLMRVHKRLTRLILRALRRATTDNKEQ